MGTVSVAIPGEGDAGRLGQGVDVAAGARLRTASESFVGLRLGDGVSLRLHESTDVTLRSAQMLELHAGRIYIDTGENRPDNTAVQVITERGIIRDIGTQFEVLQEDEQLRLRVREGAVSLESGNLSELGYAGEQLSVDARSAVTRSSIARDDADWRWIENLAVPLRVDNLPITHLLAWVTRETGRDVRFADEQAKAQAARTLLHGSIERLSPIEALDVMLATTDLDYVVLTDGSILIRRQPSATDDR
jgi:ferric-dicitrate binding protein FerR (iron transport regulator)